MAYKQSPFPKSSNSYSTSPVQGWNWYNENVANQGYLAAGAKGAQLGTKLGSVVPGVGNVAGGIIGGVVGIGAQFIKNDEASYGTLNKETGVRTLKSTPESEARRNAAQAKRDAEWQEKNDAMLAENQEMVRKRNQANKDSGGFEKNRIAADAKKLKEENPYMVENKADKLASIMYYDKNESLIKKKPDMSNDWNAFKAKSSPATQLGESNMVNRAARGANSGNLMPYSSTSQVLNGQDEANAAVNFSRFNAIAQNLQGSPTMQGNQASEKKQERKEYNMKMKASKEQAKRDRASGNETSETYGDNAGALYGEF